MNREGLRLADLVRELPGAPLLQGPTDTRVFGVHHDSRQVEPGDLFVARRGDKRDGASFVAAAEARGATAVLSAKDVALETALPRVLVDDVALGLAHAAAAVYGHPSFSMDVLGITGTNGKTTCAHLIRAAVDADAGEPRCGLVGTVGHVFRDLVVDAAHTTPEADELARVMAAMRERGATHVAMEVSSIGLSLRRTAAVRFRLAALTNFTQDHLDFHGSMEAYAEAKSLLFQACAPGGAVLHVDDPLGARLAGETRCPLVRVSARVGVPTSHADVAPLEATLDGGGIDARFRTPRGEVHITSRLVGAHNLENLAVALGAACALGLDLERAAAGLSGAAGAPGRLERCDGPEDDVVVAVDYAHTPDALARVLASMRAVTRGRVLCVFGCGGDRDPAKRVPMGEAAARGADVVVITNDNPRSEDPAQIAAAALRGVEAAGKHALVELDRSLAIEAAVLAAEVGDAVLIAGKGHEPYQIVGTEKREFDDRLEARAALLRRRTSAAGRG